MLTEMYKKRPRQTKTVHKIEILTNAKTEFDQGEYGGGGWGTNISANSGCPACLSSRCSISRNWSSALRFKRMKELKNKNSFGSK